MQDVPTYNFSIADLESIQQIEYKKSIYKYTNNGVEYNLFTHFKPGNSKLLILGQGAVENTKQKELGAPVFHRWSWSDELDYNIIILADPTIYLGENKKISLGWFQGDTENNCLFHIVKILRSLIQLLNIKNKDIVFYGSSAGGFSSLMMVPHFKGSLACVNNPQTNMFKYHSESIMALLRNNFPGMSPVEYRETYPTRFAPVPLYHKLEYIPNIYFMQNLADKYHMKHHYQVFMNELAELSQEKEIIYNMNSYIYNDPDMGHNPLSKELTIEHINKAFDYLANL